MKKCIFSVMFLLGLLGALNAQNNLQVILFKDSLRGNNIAFPLLMGTKGVKMGTVSGKLKLAIGKSYTIGHPLFKTKTIQVEKGRSIYYLTPKENIPSNNAADFIQDYVKEHINQHYNYAPFIEYVSHNNFYYKVSTLHKDGTAEFDSLEVVTINNSDFNVVRKGRQSQQILTKKAYSNGKEIKDIAKLKMPVEFQTVSVSGQYVKYYDLKYYSPLHKQNLSRYNFSFVGEYKKNNHRYGAVYISPKKGKKFATLSGCLLFDLDSKTLIAGTYFAEAKNWFFINNFEYAAVGEYYFPIRVFSESHINKVPSKKKISRIEYLSYRDNFKTTGEDTVKVTLSNIHFSPNKEEEEWSKVKGEMENRENFSLKRDTLVDKSFAHFLLHNVGTGLVSEKVGYSKGKLEISNIFQFNKVETLRLGVGMSVKGMFTERLFSGGYLGFGLKDANWKYGMHLGWFVGDSEFNYLNFSHSVDNHEPGRIRFLLEDRDLIRNYLVALADRSRTNSVSLTLRPYLSNVVRFTASQSNMAPTYDYAFQQDNIGSYAFSDASITAQFKWGAYASLDKDTRRVYFADKKYYPTMFLNLTRGLKTDSWGDFDYSKVSAKLNFIWHSRAKNYFDISLQSGIMTAEVPYPLLFGGAGSNSGVSSIFVKDAFQTMPLYRYVTNEYIHVFGTYFIPIQIKKRFKPELGLSYNFGFGKYKGDLTWHNIPNQVLEDYRDGFFESGILLNNLLSVNTFNLFYFKLGFGLYRSFTEVQNPWAFRLTYKFVSL